MTCCFASQDDVLERRKKEENALGLTEQSEHRLKKWVEDNTTELTRVKTNHQLGKHHSRIAEHE